MPFSEIDRPAVARTLSQIAERAEDLVDVYFERLEEVELPPDGGPPGLRVRREEGFAIRLVRQGRTWLAARDGIEAGLFSEALRQVARVLPTAAYPEPRLDLEPWSDPPEAPELLAFPRLVQRAIRERHVAFPLRLSLRRHRRSLLVVGPRLAADGEQERFYSATAEVPWGRFGCLLPDLGQRAADDLATSLTSLFQARQAASPETFTGPVVLGPAAAAVFLHEAVAHALEADTLALGGNPEAAVGVEMGVSGLHILDDPARAPEGVRRTTDDEGVAVVRRWLLRAGVVAQPLADSQWAQRSGVLAPGAARRGDRHGAPGPRSTHLELLPGEVGPEDLLSGAEGGLYLPEASRGSLDPVAGTFRLELPFGRRIRSGVAADPVGPCSLEGRVADLLARVVGVGNDVRSAGAGWCAKGGQKMPVWATVPAVCLEGVRISG